MNPDSPEAHANEDGTCESCGRFGVIEIGGHRLCVDCYGTCGSCCQGSMLDDSGSTA